MTESELHKRIKYAIAHELLDMGYMSGVEVSNDGTRFDVMATKNEETIAFEVHMTNLPNWWQDRNNQKVPKGIIVEPNTRQFVEDEIHGFMELFYHCVSTYRTEEISFPTLLHTVNGDYKKSDVMGLMTELINRQWIVKSEKGYYKSIETKIRDEILETVRKTKEEQKRREEYGSSIIRELKAFIETFNRLSGVNKNDVEESLLINELIKIPYSDNQGSVLKLFTTERARTFIKKAMQNGQIYERKTGWYRKA